MSILILQIDRKEEFRQVEGLVFPNGQDPSRRLLGETLLDGELVLDIDPETGTVCLSLLSLS